MWGYLANIGIPYPQKTKVLKIINSIFIDYTQNSAAYRFIIIHDNGASGAICEFRDVEFFENVFLMKSYDSCMVPTTPIVMQMLSLDVVKGLELNPLLVVTI